MIGKKIQKNQKGIISLGVFILPILIISGIKFNQQLKEKSWQELRRNELTYQAIPTCLEDINKASKSSTLALSIYFLEKGITCLDSLSFSLKENFHYQNIVSIRENIDPNNHQKSKKYLQKISRDWEKELFEYNTVVFSLYLSVYSVLLFLAYILVTLWWDDNEDSMKD